MTTCSNLDKDNFCACADGSGCRIIVPTQAAIEWAERLCEYKKIVISEHAPYLKALIKAAKENNS